MPTTISPTNHGAGRRIAIIASRFNAGVVEALVSGALTTLQKHGVRDEHITVIRVPGAWEIPVVARRLLDVPVTKRPDAVIALGCVIRGDTAHFEHVGGECARALADLAMQARVPIANGVLATNTPKQAVARAGGQHGNKGEEAALAALETANVIDAITLEMAP